MTKQAKLIDRLLSIPKDFTYNELKTLLTGFGYVENTKGATSGSRIAFFHPGSQHIIRLHKPHPGHVLKRYQLDLIIDELRNKGLIS